MSSLCGVSFISGYLQWFHSIFGLYTIKMSCVYDMCFFSYPIRLSFLNLCFDFIHFFPPAIISLVFSCTSVSVFCWDFPISRMLECFLVLQPWEALDSFYHCIFFSLCASVLLIFLVYLYPYWLFLGFLKATHKESLFLWLCLFCLAFPFNSST